MCLPMLGLVMYASGSPQCGTQVSVLEKFQHLFFILLFYMKIELVAIFSPFSLNSDQDGKKLKKGLMV